MNYKALLFPYIIKFLLLFYRNLYLSFRAAIIRRKRIINVAFFVSDLGKWKTELLLEKMREHDRFAPSIYVIPYLHNDNSGQSILVNYLKNKKYPYQLVDENFSFSAIDKPDIIFYQEPYTGMYDGRFEYKRQLHSLFCYVPYHFHTVDLRWIHNTGYLNFAWLVFFENSLVVKNLPNLMTNHGVNCFVTGLPFTDLFFQPISSFANPWKYHKKSLKKIIWAPHYSILKDTPIYYSTFLIYCEAMLSLAAKYKNDIQMVFKPHPVLLTKLYNIWGKEKTDHYYSQWEKGDNTQIALGDYVPLFLYSDAMIHDCGSFTVEYHYTKKPVMYLVKDEHHADDLNEFGKMAFDLHYKGRCVEDVENFIKDVIAGRDEKKNEREIFYQDYLLPPDGNTASDNIIKAILG